MGIDPKQIEAEINRRLTLACPPESPNAFTAAELREWVIEYLTDYDDEIARFPNLIGKPHWDLSMMDARLEDAFFAVLLFRPNGVELFCGTGDAYAIKQFSESDFPDDIDRIRSEMAARFCIPEEPMHLWREEAEAWLGRSW